jgi:hypothetical protein
VPNSFSSWITLVTVLAGLVSSIVGLIALRWTIAKDTYNIEAMSPFPLVHFLNVIPHRPNISSNILVNVDLNIIIENIGMRPAVNLNNKIFYYFKTSNQRIMAKEVKLTDPLSGEIFAASLMPSSKWNNKFRINFNLTQPDISIYNKVLFCFAFYFEDILLPPHPIKKLFGYSANNRKVKYEYWTLQIQQDSKIGDITTIEVRKSHATEIRELNGAISDTLSAVERNYIKTGGL